MGTFGLILVMFLSTAGPAAVIAFIGYAAVKAVARNPSASPKIFIVMILSFIFAEAIAILALLILYNLFAK
ncbi:MAG: ATP synthase F0 subunit C [Candidatus Omnitrophota bacterium]|jgi:F0F1-type ATP synthase membrane subunit c/vacuolar-type H+-ATPase subunit K